MWRKKRERRKISVTNSLFSLSSSLAPRFVKVDSGDDERMEKEEDRKTCTGDSGNAS